MDISNSFIFTFKMGDNFKLYSTLGLNRGASQDEIKRAYKKLAFEFHPDKNKGNPEAEARFKEISNAYNILGDENEKAKYDSLGDTNYNGGGGGGPGPNFRGHQDIFEAFFRGRGGPFGGHFDDDFQDNFFGFGMGGPGGHNNQKKCASVEKTLVLSLEEVYDGVNKNMTISLRKYCHSCNKTCNKCDGRGVIQQMRNLGILQQIFQGPCDKCQGSGTIIEPKSSCKECNGQGVYSKEQNATLIIPPGVDENYKSVFPDMGEQPKTSNQKPGDLFLNIKIEEHKQFVRKGNDLHYKCDISFVDSVVGKDISIPYFKETINLNTKIFGVLAHGKKYLIEGKGMPIINTGNKGNMYVEFNINYPKIKGDASNKVDDLRKLLEEVFI
jgi:DnaJ-class molecular chaperone